MKKIVIAGGSGFLGNVITEYFKDKVEKIIILTRGKSKTENNIQWVHWDAKNLGNWQTELNQADALINMTGKSVDCRYTQQNKDLILSSRLESTHVLGKAVKACHTPPKTWLNSSTGTIYRHSLNKKMNETNGDIGKGFSVHVATSWEEAFFSQKTPNTRKVALRTSIVLGKKGGALGPMHNLAKIGFGGKQGSGNQKISWIHELDFAKSIDFIINNSTIDGPINIVSRNPSTNAIFMKTLRTTINAPFGIPLSKPLLEIGAKIINTETELILKSRNLIPAKLEENGFKFEYPNLTKALKDLI
ncbi:TIGR01777 family oxidoreductase [Aquimarina mytili]|uniref:TIGR01777 family oxidoreductase n=1 Tax=Aquimarina mytili TaxID=874423 RepID=A0A937A1E8_9FLAO|nr:TIGR01777 family oxidoreductase [Aquimarina mytili]MBL0685096.1 TIGR01777 family oxidoreductase [Aquimarina mytili]